MRHALLLAILSSSFLACTSAPDEVGSVCATPADLVAPADLTITAKEAVVEPEAGVGFVAWTYDGDVPGPVLRIPLGETRRVKLVSALSSPVSLHFHGVEYSAEDDGSPDHPASLVSPGCAHVYTITATAAGVWPYHSHVDSRTELARGLYGAVVVPEAHEAPADVELVAFLGQLGLEGEMASTGEAEGEEGEGGEAPGFFSTINGRSFGGASVITWDGAKYAVTHGMEAHARVGDVVRWRVLNVSPDDLHTFHVHGHRWCSDGQLPLAGGVCAAGVFMDNVALAPAQGTSLVYRESAAGDWMLHCHVLDHVNDGMWAMYVVEP